MMRDAASTGKPYGLAMLDVQMPKMDGWMLARTIPAEPGVRRNAIDYLDLLRTNLQPGRTEDWASKPTHALKV